MQLDQDHPGFHDPVYRERCANLALGKSGSRVNLFLFGTVAGWGGGHKKYAVPQENSVYFRVTEFVVDEFKVKYNIDEIYTSPVFMPSFLQW